MRRLIARTVLSIAGAVACTVAGVLGAGGAPAAPRSYVAIGDSYASGNGTYSYISGSGGCYRSNYAYGPLLAQRYGMEFSFPACSGATTGSVASGQLGNLSSSTGLVTVQVGGNDVGFTRVITNCALPWWAANCAGTIRKARHQATSQLPGKLSSLYSTIRSKAPNARIIVVGYPRLFNGIDCNAGTWFSPAEMTALNSAADLLNSVIANQASAKGFAFVNPTSAFTGHAVCGSPEWVNGLSPSNIAASYHPNKLGEATYATLIAARIGG